MADTIATIANAVTSATGTAPSAGSGASKTPAASKAVLAGNFDTFLQLLTTQLKNQNPLDPLDTNQFTQQLVQFAGVEQQINMNQQLTTLVALQKATQTTSAMSFLGSTATVDGTTTKLANGAASWSFSVDKPSTATINIKSSTGALAYSGSYPLSPGAQNFNWDGRGNNGVKWPDGDYTMTVTAKDASGTTVAVSTEIKGTVDSVDLTQNPPVLKIGGQSFALDRIKQVVRPGF
ncbi:MAG: flagellar biosynthesis protein FlgD [Alphaproteobacteria bacterium]|nr:MAG: flagellar biosynthesis protein FlgD [Alphaproteobacteria bacterium]